MDAIPSGILMLFKNNSLSLGSLSLPEPINTPIGEICFTEKKEEIIKQESYSLRTLFLPLDPAISYWNGLFDHLNWQKIWSIQQRFLLW